ncbi:rhodanese-like domain-containing protein [Lacinutrix neustonica]|uniref:Rhodanese-like domain-containing protein n=1 Tax=Lacinutrix neustonica TaxID=2980107 RepID=A0A9E8SGG0_9FLAO|nr:rhodanese-like domain-containing protein [Lacinutrix neustonica]WAC01700.1 rhodanese-like domain-containing protein [Lacinutrix neustonica]
MGFLDFIFGSKKRQVQDFLDNDAIILDVRTAREWENGHIENALHIPLNELNSRIDEVKKLNKPIITCCESGVRSAKAAKFLNLNNIEATNGGGWLKLSLL